MAQTLSKALALTIDRVDLAGGVLVVRHSEETPEEAMGQAAGVGIIVAG